MTLHASDILCLVPTSTAPLQQASYLARTLRATLHVVPLPTAVKSPLHSNGLDALVGDLEHADGDQYSITIPQIGTPSLSEIAEYAEEADIDLVVTDPTTSGSPVPPLSDPATEFLLEHLNLPMFFAGSVANPDDIRSVFVPTDFSAHSLDALHNATALAELYDTPIDVLHVVESMPYVALTRTDRLSIGPTSLTEHRGRRQVRAFLREAQSTPQAARSHVAYGNPADQITAFAQRDEHTLLVMSSHGMANQPQRPLGSVARDVFMQTASPTVLLRAFGPSLLEDPCESPSTDTSSSHDERP